MRHPVGAEYLKEIDRAANSFERPDAFDIEELTNRLGTLVGLLEAAFDCPCDVDVYPSVQDASYVGHATIPPRHTATGERLWVRVSNFDCLATYGLENPGVYSTAEMNELIDRHDRERVESAIDEAGFVTVLEDTLNLRYTGRFANAVSTWFGRFFDYG